MSSGPESAGDPGDAALVAAIASGDRSALAALYDRYAPLLLAVSMRILADRREAEDLLHDVFLEAWRRAGDFDAARGSVRTWLLVRTRSRALDRRKSAGYTRVVTVEGDAAALEQVAADDPSAAPDRAAVLRALADLPPEQRQVLELGYFEGLSSAEIAARTDTPIGTVKSRVAAGLSKLRVALSAQEGAS